MSMNYTVHLSYFKCSIRPFTPYVKSLKCHIRVSWLIPARGFYSHQDSGSATQSGLICSDFTSRDTTLSNTLGLPFAAEPGSAGRKGTAGAQLSLPPCASIFRAWGASFHIPTDLALSLSLTELLRVVGLLTSSAHGILRVSRVTGNGAELSSSASTCSRVLSDFTCKHKSNDRN